MSNASDCTPYLMQQFQTDAGACSGGILNYPILVLSCQDDCTTSNPDPANNTCNPGNCQWIAFQHVIEWGIASALIAMGVLLLKRVFALGLALILGGIAIIGFSWFTILA